MQVTGNERYSIKRDKAGDIFVSVDSERFSETDDPKTIAKALSEIVKEKFSDFVRVNGQKIGINQRTAKEWIRSKDANKLKRYSKQAFIDKANAFGNADEILQATRDYIGEEIKHERSDNFSEFARGVVSFKVGERGYDADVIVGTTKSGVAILYDAVNIQPKEIVADASDTVQDRRLDESATNNSISQKNEKVNSNSENSSENRKRYALPETDSDGKALTENQRQYFSGTKVKGSDGRLLAVYHGSKANFNEFSYDFMSQNGSSEGQVFYFTDKKEMAEGYQKNSGQLLYGYLNIKNPLSDSEKTLTKKEVERLLRAVDPTGDDVVINYDNSGFGYPSKAWYARALSKAVSSIYENADTDSEILGEIINSGSSAETVLTTVKKVLGYDGYIVTDKYDGAGVYVAFTSDQFKNADNKNPTDGEVGG